MKMFAGSFIIFTCLILNRNQAFSQPMRSANTATSKSANKNLFDNIAGSKSDSKFVSALQTTGLSDTLKTKEQFTVFAPADAAFMKLPNGSLDVLMKPENKGVLKNVLLYHLVAGKLPIETIAASIGKNGGTFKVKTIQGGELTFTSKEKSLFVTDEKGGISKVFLKKSGESNGIIYQVDTVLMPGK